MAQNLFADLIPRDAPKPNKSVNAFADLIPAPVQHAPGVTGQRGDSLETEGEQASHLARKGDMAPGSQAFPDPFLGRAEGVLLGWGTEAGGAIQAAVDEAREALTGEATGPVGFGEKYQQRKAALDAQLAAAREFRPLETAGEEIIGNVQAAGVPAAKALQGVGLLGKILKGGVAGGVIGGISSAGEGDGVADRIEKGSAGAAKGAGIGAALPIGATAVGQGVRLVKAAARGVSAPVRSLADKEGFAAQKVAERLGQDQLSPQRVEFRLRKRQHLKPDLVMADVGGKNTQSLLRAASNVPSENREKLTRTLFNRQDKQLGRITADLDSAFGDSKAFGDTVESVAATRKQNAAPLFDRAYKTGTPYSFRLEGVLNRPLLRKLVKNAEEAALNRGEDFKGVFAKEAPVLDKAGKQVLDETGRPKTTMKLAKVIDTEGLHRVKMQIDETIRKIKAKENISGLDNVSVRDLTIMKRDLLNAIDNPAYKKALDQFAGDSAAVNALDDGFEEFMKLEPEEITQRLRSMSSNEADLARLGFARRIANQLRDVGTAGTNRAEMVYSPKYLSRIRAALKGSPHEREFLQKLYLERKMFKTKTAVEGNSTSAAQLAEGIEGGVEAQNIREAADMGMKLARGDAIGALASWLGRAKNYATGLRPEVADEILKMLTSKDPAIVKRAQQLVEKELTKLTKRQGTAGRVERGVNFGGFTAIPGYASGGGQ